MGLTGPYPNRERCKSFHGYASNPQLCRACHGPVSDHPEYLQYIAEKKKEHKLKSVLLDWSEVVTLQAQAIKTSGQILEETLAVLGKEGEEMIQLTPSVSMKRTEFEFLRKAALAARAYTPTDLNDYIDSMGPEIAKKLKDIMRELYIEEAERRAT